MRRCVLALVLLLGVAGCTTSDDGVQNANAVVGRTIDSITVSGTVVALDGHHPVMCSDSAVDEKNGFRCPHGGLVVDGLDLGRIPNVQRLGGARVAWPAILLTGRVEGRHLRVTGVPVVFGVRATAGWTDPSGEERTAVLLADRSGAKPELLFQPPQEIGLILDQRIDRGFPTRSVAGSHGGRLSMRRPTCPPNASCVGSFMAVKTADARVGEYTFAYDVPDRAIGRVRVTIVVEDASRLLESPG